MDIDLNTFIEDIQQAQLFEQYITLSRFKNVLSYYNTIDWSTTGMIINSSLLPNHKTSEKDSKF